MPLQEERIALTGGGGFLGQAVVRAFKSRGIDVFIVRSRDYDLRSREACRQLMADVRPTIVVHLAAVVGGIGANMANPGKYLFDNAIMGLELVEAARLAGVSKFVASGTICAYPKFTPVPFNEEDLWNGYPEETNAPYGLAKKLILAQLQAYRRQYGFNGIYLLPVNLYGPGDNFDLESSHVIPAMIRKFVSAMKEGASEIVLWGSGQVTREFLYVEDCAEAFVRATELYDGDLPVNVGTGSEIRIADLAQRIAWLTGFTGMIVWDRNRPDGQPRRCLDVARAKDAFGFESKVGLEQGLQETIRWWKSQQ